MQMIGKSPAHLEAIEPVTIGNQVLIPVVTLTALAALVVAVRWYTRAFISRLVGLDDFVILISMFVSIASCGVIGAQVHQGEHDRNWSEPGNTGEMTAKLVLASNILYLTYANTTKASIIVQYLRIFRDKLIRRCCFLLYLIIMVAFIWGVFGAIFLCRPVDKLWHQRKPGKCTNSETYWLSTAGINIGLDFMIWLLPMPCIGALRLPRRQKIGVLVVFILGGLVCVFSIIRLITVHLEALEGDYSRSGIAAIRWSAIEGNVGIVCASIIALKPLISYLLPKLFAPTGPPKHSMALAQVNAWSWQSTTSATCRQSRLASWQSAPTNSHAIKVTQTYDAETQQVDTIGDRAEAKAKNDRRDSVRRESMRELARLPTQISSIPDIPELEAGVFDSDEPTARK